MEIRLRGLDAAEACFRELGIAGTSVDDIVRVSGIARSTLYRHLGDRDDLLLAVTIREIERLRGALVGRLAEASSIEDVLVEGVLAAVDLVQDSTVLHDLVAHPSLLASDVTDQGLQSLVAHLVEFVEPMAIDHHGSIRPDLDPTVAVECLVRTITSLVTLRVRVDRGRSDVERYLRQTLVPVFVPDVHPSGGDQRTTTS